MTTLASPLEAAALAGYQALAPHYDAFTAHPAYPGWIRRLENLARMHGLTGRQALDVGCGTGKSTLPLLELGYEVTGCDPVPAMLEAARRKEPALRLVSAEITQLPVLGQFDYITCLNDVCNYVLDPDDLLRAFNALAANLAPGGVLLFDVCTPALYRDLYRRTERREHAGKVFVWRGEAPEQFAAGDIATGVIEAHVTDDEHGPRRLASRHRQRAHRDVEIRRGLDGAGLRIVAVYGQYDDGYPEPDLDPDRHTKAIYLARKTR